MLDDPNLVLFGYVLWLGSLLLILGAIGSEMEKRGNLKHDPVLRDRMNQLGLLTWKALAEKSGLSSLRLRQIRRGELRALKVCDLAKLARALNWSTVELNHKMGILSRPLNRDTQELSPEKSDAREIEQLRQQCLRLREELKQQKSQIGADFRDSTFEQLQTLLTNYPTARQIAQAKPDLPAKNLTSLFTPLDNLVESWGYQRIGSAWEQVSYDPQLHQPDTDEMKEGEQVYVRFVGYRDGDRIVCPAKVSRTLPSGMKK